MHTLLKIGQCSHDDEAEGAFYTDLKLVLLAHQFLGIMPLEVDF